ncbi:MAG: M1 family metallopeptidase [Steroidobacteraceae bacterium]
MRRILPLLPLLLSLLACSQGADAPTTAAVPPLPVAPLLSGEDARDVHSWADPAVARVTHLDLDLVADFATRTLAGTAALEVEAPGAAPVLTLDTDRLSIEAVADADGSPLPWKLGEPDAVRGTPLQVTLGEARRVRITYRTSPDAPALQWLTAQQTAGGQQPYLFSQSEAILTRSWIPTQDSPGIRQTWTARIVAPPPLTVLMSAEMRGAEALQVPGGRAWRFRMNEPVAPYLIAIAIGDLAFRELGPRTGVYTEPSRLDAAASEFADLEQLLSAAESLYGSYRWGRYDVLVLPPSFPFGGMENPRLTFATPTIIAGDKSLVSVIAHELAHSWSGNLVTNATWADFWLNEGFTSYFENRIMERVYGEHAAAMLADLGWDDLQAAIKEAGGLKGADTRLHGELGGRDPDIGMTDIAYEKGATFLRTIERAVGRERWDAYLRDYFDRHAFQPQTSARFLADLREHLVRGDAALEQQLDLDAWVYQPGLPANAVHVTAAAFKDVDAAAKAFAARGTLPVVAQWNSSERVRFLTQLPRRQSVRQLDALVKLLQLDSQRNSEVQFAWLRLAVRNRYAAAVPQVEEFLTSQGRRKYVLPLFKDLMAQGAWGRPLAQRIYAEARPGYHSVTTASVDEVVPQVAAGR